MTPVTSRHIDDMFDACATLQMISQALSEGDIGDKEAGDMSWLLGSMKKRIVEVIHLLENIQADQQAESDREGSPPRSEARSVEKSNNGEN